MLDKPQSKALRGDAQSYPQQSFGKRIGFDDQAQLLWPEMSSLEKDPAAFIAAAGLNMLSEIGPQHPNESPSSEPTKNHVLGTSSPWPTAPAIPTAALPRGLGTYDDLYQSPQRSVGFKSHTLMGDPSEIGYEDGSSTLREPHRSAAYQLSDETSRPMQDPPHLMAKAKRKSTGAYGISTPTSRIIGIGGDLTMTEPTKPMRDLMVNDWVKKQKLAKKNAASLKSRGRNKKSLVVVLKLGSEGWKKWEEQKVEPDLVTKEMVIGAGKMHRMLVEEGSGSIASRGRSASAVASANVVGSGGMEMKKRGRGRPRKNPTPVIIDLDQDGDEDEDEDEEEVIPQQKSRRRESAWVARKREEEAKADVEKAIEDEKHAHERAIEDEQKAQENAIEDEKRKIVEEKQRIIDEKQRKEKERLKAIEDEWREEEERMKAVEDEKARKEAERRRAYQEAKMIAAKIVEGQTDEAWDYASAEESDGDHYMNDPEGWGLAEEEEAVEESQGYWRNPKLAYSPYAVVIERRPGYHWKTQYKTETELALTTDKDKPTATALSSDEEYTTRWPQYKTPILKAQAAGIDRSAESVKNGLKRRRVANKYSDEVEATERGGKGGGWGTGLETNDGDNLEMEADEGYDDDGWKHGARKWMY